MSKYFVSYTMNHGGGHEYRQHYVSFTNDLSKILRGLVGRKGLLKTYLKEFKAEGKISLPTHVPGHRCVLKDITIRELSDADEEVLAKYLWRHPAEEKAAELL